MAERRPEGDVLHINATGNDRPSLEDLYDHVVMKVADRWKDLGVKLLRSDQDRMLNIIEANHPHDVVNCCKHLFNKWLDTTEDATWSMLIKALKSPSVQLDYLAGQLEKMLIIKPAVTSTGTGAVTSTGVGAVTSTGVGAACKKLTKIQNIETQFATATAPQNLFEPNNDQPQQQQQQQVIKEENIFSGNLSTQSDVAPTPPRQDSFAAFEQSLPTSTSKDKTFTWSVHPEQMTTMPGYYENMAGLMSSDLSRQLTLLIDHLNPEDKEATLSTLKQIFSNTSQYPDVDKYRQIRVANKKFSNTVWKYPAGKELMKMSGWEVEGDHIRLKDDSYIQTVTGLLETLTNDEMYEVPEEYESEMFRAVCCGDSLILRSLLQQIKIPANKILLHGIPLVRLALSFRHIGIARILIKEYSVEINSNHIHKFLSHGAPESEVIDLITEFNIDIKDIDFISYALQCKCFEIVKFAIERCGYDVNSIIRDPNNDTEIQFTLLHLAYCANEPALAEYLISKGADKNATDFRGLKPIEYSGGHEGIVKQCEYLVQHRLITRDFSSEENKHRILLLREGYSEEEAVSRVIEKFPLLKLETSSPSKCDLNDVPTMKELNRYITDMAPFYFNIGLELDVLNNQLKLIRNDPSLPDLKEKCRKMLEVWLENDTSATWMKLCDALCEIGQNVLAENIKSKLA